MSDYLLNDEDFAREQLSGPNAFLDSFRASIGLAKVEYPERIDNWFGTVQVVPSFLTYKNLTRSGYYRITGCHELIPAPKLPGVPKALIHAAVGKYDFAIDILSDEPLDDYPYHRFFAGFCCFGQSRDNDCPPKGGEQFIVDGRQYFRLFHHTSKDGKKSILESKILRSSKWNFCGTNEIKCPHCYLTDLPNIKKQFDTLPLLIRKSSTLDIVFRTDDESKVVRSGVTICNRPLGNRIAFLVDPGLIQPNPVVFHHTIHGQPKWLEILFPYVYRIPCDSINLNQSITIKNEKHWIVNLNTVNNFRQKSDLLWASGNDATALINLINETS